MHLAAADAEGSTNATEVMTLQAERWIMHPTLAGSCQSCPVYNLLLEVQAQARSAAIGKSINVSSIHALDNGNNNSPYAIGKRAGAAALLDLGGHYSLTLYLPAVIGSRLAGRLAILNGLPKPIFGLAVRMLSATRPQIWNIVRNEVSLVGLRSCLPGQSAPVEARRRRGILELKPGITGLAQSTGSK